MNGSKTLDEKSLLSLYEGLNKLSDALNDLRESIRVLLPAKHGSDLWWEKETKESLKDYDAGKYKTFSNVTNFMKDLNK